MGLIIGILLGLISLVVLALPFFRKERVGGRNAGNAGGLREQRISIYQEIRTLENDLNLGQVPQEEYEQRLRDYRLRAAELMMEEEELKQIDFDLEEEITLRRRNGNNNSTQDDA